MGYATGYRAGAGAESARTNAELATLRRVAYTDNLTGLPNRAALDAEQARRSRRPERYGLLLIDLDRFKQVNDRFGHAAGDTVLAEVARRLAKLTPAGGFAGRLGGDEFVLIAPDWQTRRLADAVRQAVARPVPLGGAEVSVGASVGVAHAGPGTAAGEVLRRADEQMYRVKAARTRAAEYTRGVAGPDAGTGDAGSRPRIRLRDLTRLPDRQARRLLPRPLATTTPGAAT
jgi:diguanylate cyclase (GGDEF)-like protein